MAESKNGNKGGSSGEGQIAPVQAQIVGQYIKDLSFENPNVGRLLEGPGENPQMKLQINVAAERVGADLYESAIDFKAVASNATTTIYDLECVYAGLFKLNNIPENALEPFLLINCPSILFPFLRRLVADVSREGGFPPLLLDPVDFASLYVRRQQEMASAQTPTKIKN
jgi:preprotein translocase subunit SecB